jgi:hypothetical protein
MKTIACSLLFVLALAAGPLRADAAPQDYDTVTLKDGRVVQGQVVEERKDTLVLTVRGVRRSFGRDFIAKVSYGSGPEAGVEGSVGPDEGAGPGDAEGPSGAVPHAPTEDLATALSVRYRVPLGDVLWVRRQGVSDADLPLVFLVAATAGVTPRRVVKLIREGWSWSDIENYFQMQPDGVYYETGPWGPYPCYGDDVYPWGDYGWDGYGWGGAWGGGYGRGRGWGGNRGFSGGGGGRGRLGNGRASFGGSAGGGFGGHSGAGGAGGRAPLGGASGSGGGHSGGGRGR